MTAANLGTTTMTSAAAETAPQSPLADPNADPLAPKAVEVKKGRYSDRAKLPKKPKVSAANGKVDPFAPPPPTTQELETQKAQSAPLGLGGNTAAKPKKKKRQKGEKKERLQGKQKQAPVVQQPSSAPSQLAAPGPEGVPLQGGAPNGNGEPLQGAPAAGPSSVPPSSGNPPATSNPAPPQN